MGQLHRLMLGRQERQQLLQPSPALARRHEAAPVGDGEVHGGERARGQDRPGDDDARRRLLADHEECTDGQRGRLQDHAQHPVDRAEAAADVARPLLRLHVAAVCLAPLVSHAAREAHRHDHLGVLPAGFREAVAGTGKARRLHGRLARVDIGEDGEDDQHDCADQRSGAQQRVECKQDEQIERKPGQVEQGSRRAARKKRADSVEIADRLDAVVTATHAHGHPHHRVVDAPRKGFIERGTDPKQQARADQIDQALAREQDQRQHGQSDQRRYAAAGQHPVVDLEHEEGAREHQDAAHAAQQPDARTAAPSPAWIPEPPAWP